MATSKKVGERTVKEIEDSMTPAQVARAMEIMEEERERRRQLEGQPTMEDAYRTNQELPTTIRLGAVDRHQLIMLAHHEGKPFSQLIRELIAAGLQHRQSCGVEATGAPPPTPLEMREMAQALAAIAARLAPALALSEASEPAPPKRRTRARKTG